MTTKFPYGLLFLSFLTCDSNGQGTFDVFSEVSLGRYSMPEAQLDNPTGIPIHVSGGSDNTEWKRHFPFYHVSLFVGSGYNIFDGQPGTASLDTGINTVYSKILHKTYLPATFQTGCPEEAFCTHFQSSHVNPTNAVSPVTVIIRNIDEYRNYAARNIRLVGPSSIRIPEVVGISTQLYDTLSDDFEEGAVLLDRKRTVLMENVVYNYRVHKMLTSNFVAAVCELPSNYDYDSYSGLFTEFGTHIIVGIQAGEIAVDRTIVSRRNIFDKKTPCRMVFCGRDSKGISPVQGFVGFAIDICFGRSIVKTAGIQRLENFAVTFLMENVVYNYRVHKMLTSNFVAAVCELPSNYDYDSYSGLFTEFGTHIIVGIQAGEIAVDRTIVSRRNIFEEYQDTRSKDCANFLTDSTRLSQSFVIGAANKMLPNSTLHSYGGSVAAPNPISFVLRELSEFFTVEHFNDSEIICDHLQTPEMVAKLRKNLKTALMETASKANASRMEKKNAKPPMVCGIAEAAAGPENSGLGVQGAAQHFIPPHVHNQRHCANDTCGWPDGHYGLLRAKDTTGCPAGNALTTWITGRRYHKVQTGFVGSAEMFVDVGYLSPSSEIFLNFCMKKTNQYTLTTSTANIQPTVHWEPGAYCLYRSRRGPCPDNFQSGSYFFNDIKIASKPDSGEVPEGESYQCHDDRGEPHFCGTDPASY